MVLIIDTSTGTVLAADQCVFLEDDALSDAEWESFEGMADSEVDAIGRERGRPVLSDVRALDAITGLLSGNEWDTETIEAVAELVTETGRTIADLNTP